MAVLCCAVLCCAVLCCAVLCCAVLCCAVLCCAAWLHNQAIMQACSTVLAQIAQTLCQTFVLHGIYSLQPCVTQHLYFRSLALHAPSCPDCLASGSLSLTVRCLAGVRVDSWIERGTTVSPHYDSLLAKLMVFAPDRAAATKKMSGALAETQVRPCCAKSCLPAVYAPAAQHSTAQHSTAQHSTAQHSPAQPSPAQPAQHDSKVQILFCLHSITLSIHQCKQPTNVCLQLGNTTTPTRNFLTLATTSGQESGCICSTLPKSCV